MICALVPVVSVLSEQAIEHGLVGGAGAAGLDALALLLALVTPSQFLAQLFRRLAFQRPPN
jgi:hypothetical protein